MKNIGFALTLILFALAMSFSFQSCDPEPEIITNTIIETDTLIVVQQDTVFVMDTDTVSIIEVFQDTLTTFILVRHAETTGIGSDPDLSAEGMARAATLSALLEQIELSAVYSTDLKRTTQTAEVVATANSLPVENYEPFVLDPLVDGVLEDHKDETVLVVGHSNTTPSLLNLLVGEDIYDVIPESEYDNLYIVSVYEKGRAKVVHLKYGE